MKEKMTNYMWSQHLLSTNCVLGYVLGLYIWKVKSLQGHKAVNGGSIRPVYVHMDRDRRSDTCRQRQTRPGKQISKLPATGASGQSPQAPTLKLSASLKLHQN